MRVKHLGAFIRLGRPTFLVGGLALHGLGAAVAVHRGGDLDWRRFAYGQLGVSATQLMTHYANDYFDFAADLANRTPTRWSGGSRVLTNGELPRWVALATALVLAAIAVTTAAALYAQFAAGVTAALLLVAIVLSWSYSGPPFYLHSRGVGEFVTMIVVTMLVPLIGFAGQTGRVEAAMVAAAAPLCFLQFAMVLAVEFPDEASDTMVAKRTLVVRLGGRRAAVLYSAALVLTYLLLPAWTWLGLHVVAAIALMAASPLALWLVSRILRGEHLQPDRWNRLAFASAALVALSALFELGAYATLARSGQEGEQAVKQPRKPLQQSEDFPSQSGVPGHREHALR